ELLGNYVGDAAKNVGDAVKHSMGSVLFIDEAYQWSRQSGGYGQAAIDSLVKLMEDNRDKFMVILAGYPKEMDEFLSKNPGLRSRFASQVEFEDFSLDQLVSIFRKMLTEKEYTLAEGADKAAKKLINDIRNGSEDFGNGRGVRKVVNEVLRAVDTRIARADTDTLTKEECLTVKVEDIESLLDKNDDTNEKSVDELLAELDAMTGLKSVKAKIKSIVGQARFNILAKEQGLEEQGHGTLHLLFKGNAGTGKTTIARTLGEIYYKLGMIRKPDVVECDRSSLVAGYVGQTASKTTEVINRAMGGILFVDEAYTLASGGENDYGKEALTTIMKAMEDHRDDLMVIFAGYDKELDELVKMNQGLSSRFSKQNEIIFEDYTNDELTQIFIYQAKKKNMLIDEKLRPDIEKVIKVAKAATTDFGNARGIRNLLDAADANRKQRIAQMAASGIKPDKETMMRLTIEDLAVLL
nr:AAA family ATPase [Lachnospiraceae bacterium]